MNAKNKGIGRLIVKLIIGTMATVLIVVVVLMALILSKSQQTLKHEVMNLVSATNSQLKLNINRRLYNEVGH